MRMSLKSYNGMNILLSKCFNANAIFDNLAYNLDYHYYNNIADIVHHQIAHLMPVLADQVSDQMLMLSARPVRKEIGGYEKDYKDDLKSIFTESYNTLIDLRDYARELIESSDMDGDDEVRMFAEKFVDELQPLIKQIDEWLNAISYVDGHNLDIHIKDYTHFIINK